MKKSLDHLPAFIRNDLKYIVKIIRKISKVEMIILFGSYARGDYVVYDKTYVQGTGYYKIFQSDHDILVILQNKEAENQFFNKLHQIEDIMRKRNTVNGFRTPVSIIFDNIVFVNEKLREGNSFYRDIVKEGIELYNSNKFKLTKAYTLSPAERKKIAQRDFDTYFNKAEDFLLAYNALIKKGKLKTPAFMLHQVAEALYNAILLVFTGYSPKIHDLDDLVELVKQLHSQLPKIFPKGTQEGKRLFELLRKAYVDARYSPSYKITRKELEYLEKRVNKLMILTQRICNNKIKKIK